MSVTHTFNVHSSGWVNLLIVLLLGQHSAGIYTYASQVQRVKCLILIINVINTIIFM